MLSCRLAARSTSTRRRHACCHRQSDDRIRPGSSGSFVEAFYFATGSAGGGLRRAISFSQRSIPALFPIRRAIGNIA